MERELFKASSLAQIGGRQFKQKWQHEALTIILEALEEKKQGKQLV